MVTDETSAVGRLLTLLCVGQFELGVVDTAISLLDLARLRSMSRNSAVNVVRTIAKLVSQFNRLYALVDSHHTYDTIRYDTIRYTIVCI